MTDAATIARGSQCRNCRFFWLDEKRCRRLPPQRIAIAFMYGITIGASARFPTVKEDWWCGEHRQSARAELEKEK